MAPVAERAEATGCDLGRVDVAPRAGYSIVQAMDAAPERVAQTQELPVPVSEHLPEDVVLAIDTFALKNEIADRQEALHIILRDALLRLGYLPRIVEEGTRPEDLTTENDR